MEDLAGRTIGGYQIVEQIGKGGMASVYRAYQPSLDRDVAIKVLPPYYAQQDESFLQRFKREARAVAKLRHPNILMVMDYGEEGDLVYIVMEYVNAGTLKDRMHKPLPLSEITSLVSQISDALSYAHEQGIVHRDIKPSNILLPRPDWALLTDFGLAHMVGGSLLTQSGITVGTPAYMSPEQGSGEKIDHRTDIYAMGVMLYEMTVGEVPYTAETPMAIVVKHIVDPLPIPRKKNPNIPKALQRVILKALAKNPDDRYQSAAEFTAALKDVSQQHPDWSAAEMKAVNALRQPQENRTETKPMTDEDLQEAQAEAETIPPVDPLPPALSPEPISESAQPASQPAEPTSESKPLAAAPAPKKKRRWMLFAGGALILVLCLLAGLAGMRTLANRRTAAQPTNTVTIPVVNQPNPEDFLSEDAQNTGDTMQQVLDLITQGDFDRARDLAVLLLRFNPEMWDSYMGVVDLLINQGEMDRAIRLLQAGLEATPTAPPEAYALAGWLLLEVDRPEEALPAFEEAVRRAPGFSEAHDGLVYTAIQTDLAAQEIGFLNGMNGELSEEPLIFRSLGDLYLYLEDYPEAINAYDQALALRPDDPMLLIHAYVPHWIMGQDDKASEMVIRAADSAPDDPALLGQIGDALMNLNMPGRARDIYGRAFQLDDQNGWHALGLAQALDAMGEEPERIPPMLQAAERLANDQQDPWLMVEIAWFHANKDQCEIAIRLFEQAERMAPDETDARDGLDMCK